MHAAMMLCNRRESFEHGLWRLVVLVQNNDRGNNTSGDALVRFKEK